MAPLAIRQNHSLVPSPPRPHKGPFTRPVEVTGHIDPVVFAKLFAGTVGIFIISVLIWKSGNLIRSFTQHRILEEGRSPNTRYAKTWYGWVNVQTHERNKQFFRNIFAKLKDWTAWKSTRTDYRWAWWDPGQEALEARRKQKQRLKWLPRFLFSYEHPTADEIWNPAQLPECHGAVLEQLEPDPIQLPERAKQPSEENVQPIPQKRFKTPSKEDRVAMLKPQASHRHSNSKLSIAASEDRLEDVIWSDARMYIQSSTISLEHQESLTERGSVNTSINLKRDQFSKRRSSLEEDTVHLPQFDGPSTFRATRPRVPASQSRKIRDSQPVLFHRGNLRKYQAWSAMMQGESAKALLQDLKDSSGPPGTPMMDLLSSLASENSNSELLAAGGKQKQRLSRQSRSSAEKIPFIVQRGVRGSRGQPLGNLNPNLTDINARPNTAPLRIKRIPTTVGSSEDLQHSLRRRIIDRHTVHELLQPQEANWMGHQDRQPTEAIRATFNELNDWEIRLLHKLDRNLVWLFNETTPGQKPYHFALLANHWLNRETWLVIDPISRVSTDARRIQGDPRFNVPYLEPDLNARPKYPVPVRTRIHPPRIDSWRAAVNRHRRLSGVRERVPPVELYLESAEEPPDGHIDTACWMLPKPPQGFEMSSKQRNAWYEGGAGWQETLDDWKLVKRGYRLRKGIFEGRVNRHRVMEIGRSVYGHSRRTLHKLSQNPAEATPSPTPQNAVSCVS